MTDNELIAEFMEYKLKQGKQLAQYISGGHEWYWVGENFTIDEPSWLPESNWNLLMPVVEALHEPVVNDGKIIRSGCEITIYYKACKLEFTPDEDFEDIEDFEVQTKGETKLEAVYKAVVEFIKWYNQNRKQ